METIFVIGIVGFVIGVILGKFARYPIVISAMILLTIVLLVSPILLMAGSGMIGLAVAVLIPAVVPPLVGYWSSFLMASVSQKPRS